MLRLFNREFWIHLSLHEGAHIELIYISRLLWWLIHSHRWFAPVVHENERGNHSFCEWGEKYGTQSCFSSAIGLWLNVREGYIWNEILLGKERVKTAATFDDEKNRRSPYGRSCVISWHRASVLVNFSLLVLNIPPYGTLVGFARTVAHNWRIASLLKISSVPK